MKKKLDDPNPYGRTPLCPFCGGPVGYEEANANTKADGYARCIHCGQAIVWSITIYPKRSKAFWAKPVDRTTQNLGRE